ncbi:hypothetical protein CDAR_231951 [Caerostris darwini]|uniref:Uncharacterized protein n=1 Tax=Caerostris darwini TaxID=1538125 RepID=A0AAV4VZM4_9ARAC|nr:hypothetical protein CDAR_231951 [Caerostris darwini]
MTSSFRVACSNAIKHINKQRAAPLAMAVYIGGRSHPTPNQCGGGVPAGSQGRFKGKKISFLSFRTLVYQKRELLTLPFESAVTAAYGFIFSPPPLAVWRPDGQWATALAFGTTVSEEDLFTCCE